MIRPLLLILALLTAFNSICQQKCDSAELRNDKILLQKFWTEFKAAINYKDRTKLASLWRFPFACDYCIVDSTKPDDKPYKVTRRIFDKTQYQKHGKRS